VKGCGCAVLGLLLVAAPICVRGAHSEKFELIDVLVAASAAPTTRAIAEREGFPLGDVQLADASAKAGPGDSVTALVSLSSFDGRLKPKQWIIRLRLSSANFQPQPNEGPTKDTTYYTNCGDVFAFHSAVSPMDLETLGPIPADSRTEAHIEEKRTRIAVNTEFLGLNLNRAANVILRLRQQEAKVPGTKYGIIAGGSPFPAAESDANGRKLEAIGIGEDDRRAFTGSLPALEQFLDIVRRTPDLQGILLEILDRPSAIDIFRSAARENITFQFIVGGHSTGQEMFWKGPTAGEFGILAFNLEIYGKPVLTAALFVTAPAPPLEVSAGVLGVVAFSPSEPDKFVVVRVLSSAPWPAYTRLSGAHGANRLAESDLEMRGP
jgi:hypothetical protein